MKRTITLLLALILVVAAFTGCSEKKETNAGGDRMTISIGYPNADEAWKKDEYFKYITDKLNINIDFHTLPSSSAAEKARIWISSGDMPDVVYSDFQLDEYLKYSQQGMVRTLPEGWEEKYPNLGFAMEMTGILDFLKGENNGDVSILIRPMDHYRDYIGDFRTAYSDGKNFVLELCQTHAGGDS